MAQEVNEIKEREGRAANDLDRAAAARQQQKLEMEKLERERADAASINDAALREKALREKDASIKALKEKSGRAEQAEKRMRANLAAVRAELNGKQDEVLRCLLQHVS